MMRHRDAALAAWNGKGELTKGIAPEWPMRGVAIEGDFSGIQRFVLRPVPGASGAARRLRARSFRVLALTRLAAAKVQERFAQSAARLFYSAGGRFLVVAQPTAGWCEPLVSLQKEIDEDLLRDYRGELVFHIVGAEFEDGRIPIAQLAGAMALRKFRPLGGALQDAAGWGGIDRFACSGVGEQRCQGCGSTTTVREESDGDETELLCRTCIDDRELGKQLMTGGVAALVRSADGPISLLGQPWRIAAPGEIRIPHIAHAPLEKGRLADFDQLAERAIGRKYLAYLRIDADQIGEEFRKLEGDPYRTWGLSQLLDEAFSAGVDGLLRTRFSNLYPVYGGGDDLFWSVLGTTYWISPQLGAANLASSQITS
jgi:CRISPR-associated protein Csm1